MRNTAFELHKVVREINTHGSEYQFTRLSKDKYGEDTDRGSVSARIKGLYHISDGYKTQMNTDAGITATKGQPMILCEVTQESNNIKNGDIVDIYTPITQRFKVVTKDDVASLGIIYDISLERVQTGTSL